MTAANQVRLWLEVAGEAAPGALTSQNANPVPGK